MTATKARLPGYVFVQKESPIPSTKQSFWRYWRNRKGRAGDERKNPKELGSVQLGK